MVIYCFVLGAMCLDIITGLLMAAKNHDIDSTKMRDGLFKKVANGIFCFIGWACDYAQGTVELPFKMPVGGTIALAIIIMELISILENLGKINPDLVKLIKPYLKKLKSEE